MKRILPYLVLCSLAASAAAYGQAGTNSFEFLLIGPGSRASAMGEAFTAVSGDAGAPYFNPASAALMNGTEFSFMHVAYLTDVSMDHLSVLARSGSFRYGVGLYYGKTGNIQRRGDTPTDDPLGLFDEHNFTAAFTWAVPVSNRLSIGNYRQMGLPETRYRERFGPGARPRRAFTRFGLRSRWVPLSATWAQNRNL